MTKLIGTIRDCANAPSKDVRKCYSEVLYYGSRGMGKSWLQMWIKQRTIQWAWPNP